MCVCVYLCVDEIVVDKNECWDFEFENKKNLVNELGISVNSLVA